MVKEGLFAVVQTGMEPLLPNGSVTGRGQNCGR